MKKISIVLTLMIVLLVSGCMTNYQRGYYDGLQEIETGYVPKGTIVEVPIIEYVEVEKIVEVPVEVELELLYHQ